MFQIFLIFAMQIYEKMSGGQRKQIKNLINILAAGNPFLFEDCLNVLKENMRHYYRYMLSVQSSEEAKKEKEEKKKFLIRKVSIIPSQ